MIGIVPALVLAFAGVGYPPPSEYDVLRVMQKDFQIPHGEFFDPATLTDQYSLRFNNYPVDVILKHCDPVVVQGDTFGRRDLLFEKGYSCLFGVISYAVPPYDVLGIFSFQEGDWRFIGYNQPRAFRPQQLINRTDKVRTRRSLKPGSIPYDPFPADPINDVDSPYADLFTLPN